MGEAEDKNKAVQSRQESSSTKPRRILKMFVISVRIGIRVVNLKGLVYN